MRGGDGLTSRMGDVRDRGILPVRTGRLANSQVWMHQHQTVP